MRSLGYFISDKILKIKRLKIYFSLFPVFHAVFFYNNTIASKSGKNEK